MPEGISYSPPGEELRVVRIGVLVYECTREQEED